jgi:uridine kinase
LKTNDIIEIIKQNMTAERLKPFLVAIDGMSASGKTTLGNLLHMEFEDSNLFHMDDYFLQPHQRTDKRLCEVGGNVDYKRFMNELVLHVNDREGLSFHKYDCQTQTLGPATYVPWKPLVIIEGAYSQHPYFGNIYDLRIFCEISKEEQRERILKRNGAEMLKRFENEWIPKEHAYFEFYDIKKKSGLQ